MAGRRTWGSEMGVRLPHSLLNYRLMIDASKRIYHGWIILKQPFRFAELEEPLQMKTILYAYSERPVIKRVLTEKALEERDSILNQSIMFTPFERKEDIIDRQVKELERKNASWEEEYHGEIMQVVINGVTTKFFPEEYDHVSEKLLSEYLEDEAYHMVAHPGLFKNQEFLKRRHYIQSRGVDERIAGKWVSIGFKDLVMYKPYFQLLKMFARDHEIYADPFYERVEGIDFTRDENGILINA